MIYLGFIFDYCINAFLPINSYFIVNNIEENKLFEVIVIGIILDFLFGRYFYNLAILLSFYYLSKLINVKKKYLLLKNIIIYTIYFGLMNVFFGYNSVMLISYLIGLVLQLIYYYISRMLLNY